MKREDAKANLELIIAFANGEIIQYLDLDDEWVDTDSPMFYDHGRYRVKPKRKYALYNPNSHEFVPNLEYFNEHTILTIISKGWEKVELVKLDK